MRYRPFGASGKAVSAISLLLREAPNMTTPQAWRTMVFAAMENGVNYFELTAGVDVMSLGVGEALRAVERRLLFLSWRLRGDGSHEVTGEDIAASVKTGLQKTGAGYFDMLMIDEVVYQVLTESAHAYLSDLKAAGLCLNIGIAGEGAAVDDAIATGMLDVLATPFNLTSDWKARRRIRDAATHNMAIVAYDPYPSMLVRGGGRQPTGGPARGVGALLRRTSSSPLAGTGTYDFLQQTPGWAPEEICLGYLLTEPTFASIQVEAFRAETIARVAAVPDRDLPTGVAAQIEMARFSDQAAHRRRA